VSLQGEVLSPRLLPHVFPKELRMKETCMSRYPKAGPRFVQEGVCERGNNMSFTKEYKVVQI
jgi:hypothetical protein